MAWFRVIDKRTHERQHVQCRPSEVRDQYPADRFFLPRQLNRAPTEADVFEDGRLKKCRATAERIEAAAALDRMSRSELVAEILRRVREGDAK